MWRLVKLGYRAEPRLLVFAFGMVLFAALPDALLALWLKLIAQGVVDDERRLVYIAAAGLGISATATWFLKVVGDRAQRRFRDRVTIFLESHVARLQASVPTIEHHERPEYLDRLSILARPGVHARPHVHVGLLDRGLDPAPRRDDRPARVGEPGAHPAGRVRAADRRDGELATRRRARRRGTRRVARSVWPGTTSSSEPPRRPARRCGSKDSARVSSTSGAPHGRTGTRRCRPHGGGARSGTRSRGRSSAAPTSVRSSSSRPVSTRRSVTCLLVLAAGSRLSQYVGATVGEIGFLRGIWLDGARVASRGSRTTRRRSTIAPTRKCRTACTTASSSTTCRSATPVPSDSCSTTSTSRSRPVPSSRSSARTVPASRRS